MSKARPTSYQKFFWSDFFADTAELDGFQAGIYLILIGRYWVKGQPVVDDDAVLARVTCLSLDQWLSVRPAIEPFFVISSGVWRHKRIDHDLTEAHETYAKAVSASKHANDKRWGSKKTEPQPVDEPALRFGSDSDPKDGVRIGSQPEPEPEPEPIKKERTPKPPSGGLEGFEDFWQAYSRHDARKAAEKAWPAALKAVGGDPSVLIQAAKAYSKPFVTRQKDRKWQALPASWLNGERWTDQAILPQAPPKTVEPMQETLRRLGAEIAANPPQMIIPTWFKGD